MPKFPPLSAIERGLGPSILWRQSLSSQAPILILLVDLLEKTTQLRVCPHLGLDISPAGSRTGLRFANSISASTRQQTSVSLKHLPGCEGVQKRNERVLLASEELTARTGRRAALGKQKKIKPVWPSERQGREVGQEIQQHLECGGWGRARRCNQG